MKLQAETRSAGNAETLRREGRLPGVVYNKELNVPVHVELKDFDRVFRDRGTSQVIDLDVGGESHEVLVKSVQMDKRRRVPQHVDFYAVTAGMEVEVAVHVDYQGTPAGAKTGGQVDVQRREIRIRILPRLIPGHLSVDVSGLQINDALHIADVKDLLPAEAEILDEEALTLIAVLPPRLVADEETETEEAVEPEVIGEAEEGEEGEEGEGGGEDEEA